MERYGTGSRVLAMLLALVMVVSCFPGTALAASVGDIISEGSGLDGDVDSNDTIGWPIRIYDYLADGMLFDFSSAQDAYIYAHNGGSYGGGQPMPMTGGICGVDYTSVAGYFKVSSTGAYSPGYAFTHWGDKAAYAKPYDTDATETLRQIVQPVEDASPMHLRLTHTGTAGKSSLGWVADFAKDGVRYMSKEDIRYVVVVYRTNDVYAGSPGDMRFYWSVADRAYSASADISGSAGDGWNGTGLYEAAPVEVSASEGWTYLVADMKTDPFGVDFGIASNWSIIRKDRVAGVGIGLPLDRPEESMDISHIACFATPEEAERFGRKCVAFDEDPGEYLGYTIDMTQRISGTSLKTTVTRSSSPVVPGMWNMGNNQAFSLLFASSGGGWAQTNAAAGGDNTWANGYYSYQIGKNYFTNVTTESYRRDAAAKGHPVSDSIYLLNTYGRATEDGFDMSQLDLGYALHGTLKGEGIMTAGLLESGMGSWLGMDGKTHRIPVYKEDTVSYLAYLLRDALTIPERDGNGYNYNYVMGTPSPQFCEDVDGDGTLDASEDFNGNGRLDALDLASALREVLDIRFPEDLKSITAQDLRATVGAPMGSYAETARKFQAGPDGENLLIGPYLMCVDHIGTVYDAAWYLLHNLFVPGSYNQPRADYGTLVLSKGVSSDGTQAYVFDSAFTTFDAQSATVYDEEQGVIYQQGVEDRHQIVYQDTYSTALYPFLPIGPAETGPYAVTGTRYVRDDGAESVKGVGDSYAGRNYSFVLSASGEFTFNSEVDQWLEVAGDDDMYLFINGELVMDVGAAHSATTMRCVVGEYVNAAWQALSELPGYELGMADEDLEDLLVRSGIGGDQARAMRRHHKLCLVDGQRYPIEFYYMERRAWGSNLRLASSFQIREMEDAGGTDADILAEGSCGEYLDWVLYPDGVLQIMGQGDMDMFAEMEDQPWADYRDRIVGVVIEEGVTSIGSYAFSNCTRLEDVIIPPGVWAISEGAFAGCSALTDIWLPMSLYLVEEGAFQDTGLVWVTYAGTSDLWSEVRIGQMNDPLVWAQITFEGNVQDSYHLSYDEGDTNWPAVYAYYWSEEDGQMACWPGKEMTYKGNGIYICDIPVGADYVIFNDGQEAGERTPELMIPGSGYLYQDGAWVCLCEHDYGPGEITTEPGCETDGVLTYTCTLCGQSDTEIIPAMGHSYGCIRTEPGCEDEGSLVYTCEGCGDSYSEPIPALGHGYVLDRTQVFCDKDGLAVYVCTACGHSYSEPIPAMGHSYACVRREPTCEEDGALVYTCSGCGDSYSEPIPALDHDYESQLLEVFCDREGREVLVCTTCGDSFEELIPPMGHRYESVWKDPSCEETGGEVYTCENCGDSYTDVVPALGHAYDCVRTEPSCEEEGSEVYTCENCGDSYTNVVPAMGHSFAEGICGVCGAADPDWVADPGLVLGYPTLSFEDEVIYNVYYTVEDMTSVVEMGLMLLPKLDQEATIEDATALVPGFVTNGVAYLVNSGGIPAARMGQTVYFKVYAKLTDGSYAYSAAGGYNAKAYANSILSGDSSDDMKRLVVAMLEYGAEAQRYFGQDDVLMDGSLTEEHRALVEAYDASMMDDVVKADPAKTGNFLRDNANFRSLYPSVSFDGAFAINVYCVPAVAVDGKMTMYWWDVETMESVEALNVDNAVGSMEMTASSGIWWGQVAGIAAKEMDKTYYMSCVFESGGETVTTGVIAYSLGKYCEGKAATEGDPQQDFAKATAVYGYYAKRYFENND